MNLIALDLDTIRFGTPLPYALWGADGALLARKGFVVRSRNELDVLVARGRALCVDVDESEQHHRAYVGKLYDLVRDEKPLGQIATMKIVGGDLRAAQQREASGPPDWLELQTRANTLLRTSSHPEFLAKLDRLYEELSDHALRHPDAAMCALIHMSASEIRSYSATHAMLVCVICSIAARDVLQWPEDTQASLGKAALTMNISMTAMQDLLAVQTSPLTAEQIRTIEQHAERSVTLLQRLGVTDNVWLEAVRRHHDRAPGPLAEKALEVRVARLIQRADVFSARLSPRASRLPMSPTAAMQASYFDEEHHVDEAGASLIKAVGVHSPGSFVRLASNEVAIVIRRGANTTAPRVAVVINKQGLPTGEPIVRDTSQPAYKITGSVAHREVKVQIQMERLLALI
ncbi:MAG TPA: HD domain-containing phosphohydrolase [Burkholderiaceae bacterium]|nr:HD domain-containing phosphohydrolase [Burkholderiaceae bacterium]